jgi:hypothetical protein
MWREGTEEAQLGPAFGKIDQGELVTLSARLGPDDFVEALDDLQHFLRGGTGKLLPNAFNSQSPNLTDFHPRP